MSERNPAYLLMLAGPQAIRQATQTQAMLAAAMTEHGDVVVDCGDVTEVDLTFVQILLAASRSAAAAGHLLRLQAPPQGALLAVLERGGFLPADDAGADPACWGAAHAGLAEKAAVV